MISIGVIKTSDRDRQPWPADFTPADWYPANRDGVAYSVIHMVTAYLTPALQSKFQHLFQGKAAYQSWLNSTDIVPLYTIAHHLPADAQTPGILKTAVLTHIAPFNLLQNSLTLNVVIKTYQGNTELTQLAKPVTITIDNTNGAYNTLMGKLDSGQLFSAVLQQLLADHTAQLIQS